ncbi:hypothetical protein FISHEDRAFT_61275 [Fistulina hepatica ATCC 64428]|uniref:Uncharacterized protein n=1 Tax=Fistulina hepatica ATCC 64428 TaxID=1128425 RepID=A0A0D7A4F5_9AGAR|nr:hypothetical protein FISHEDRAFT_61275 [Fistulina hepatica ATCC 64428]
MSFIKRIFSRHRRARSDTFTVHAQENTKQSVRYSLQPLPEISRSPLQVNIDEPPGNISHYSPASDIVASPSPPQPQVHEINDSAPLKQNSEDVGAILRKRLSEFAALRDHLSKLIDEQHVLQEYNGTLWNDLRRLADGCRSQEAEQTQVAARRSAVAVKTMLDIARRKNDQLHIFSTALLDLGLDPDPRMNSIRSSQVFSIVEAVKKAATDPTTVWHKIVPKVVAATASNSFPADHERVCADPEEYAHTIDDILRLRRELRSARKMKAFWKRRAQHDGTNMDIVTPSNSHLAALAEVEEPADSELVGQLGSPLQPATTGSTESVSDPPALSVSGSKNDPEPESPKNILTAEYSPAVPPESEMGEIPDEEEMVDIPAEGERKAYEARRVQEVREMDPEQDSTTVQEKGQQSPMFGEDCDEVADQYPRDSHPESNVDQDERSVESIDCVLAATKLLDSFPDISSYPSTSTDTTGALRLSCSYSQSPSSPTPFEHTPNLSMRQLEAQPKTSVSANTSTLQSPISPSRIPASKSLPARSLRLPASRYEKAALFADSPHGYVHPSGSVSGKHLRSMTRKPPIPPKSVSMISKITGKHKYIGMARGSSTNASRLPPLASETFHAELMETHSSEKISLSSMARQTRVKFNASNEGYSSDNWNMAVDAVPEAHTRLAPETCTTLPPTVAPLKLLPREGKGNNNSVNASQQMIYSARDEFDFSWTNMAPAFKKSEPAPSVKNNPPTGIAYRRRPRMYRRRVDLIEEGIPRIPGIPEETDSISMENHSDLACESSFSKAGMWSAVCDAASESKLDTSTETRLPNGSAHDRGARSSSCDVTTPSRSTVPTSPTASPPPGPPPTSPLPPLPDQPPQIPVSIFRRAIRGINRGHRRNSTGSFSAMLSSSLSSIRSLWTISERSEGSGTSSGALPISSSSASAVSSSTVAVASSFAATVASSSGKIASPRPARLSWTPSSSSMRAKSRLPMLSERLPPGTPDMVVHERTRTVVQANSPSNPRTSFKASALRTSSPSSPVSHP